LYNFLFRSRRRRLVFNRWRLIDGSSLGEKAKIPARVGVRPRRLLKVASSMGLKSGIARL
jgi:hypothetical protein